MTIYLDEPIHIAGIKVSHTREGLKFLIDHYTGMLSKRPEARTMQATEHMQSLITNWKLHIELYEKYPVKKLTK
jgi:hypothetical protein